MFRKLFLLSLFAACAAGQQSNVTVQPDISFSFGPLTTTGTVQFPSSTQSYGIKYWRINYQSTGFSVVSITLQSAPDSSGAPGTWVTMPGTVFAGTNPLTSTTGAITSIIVDPANDNPWIRVNATTLTGTGAVSGRVMGYRQNPDGGGCPAPCPVLGNAVTDTTAAWTSATPLDTALGPITLAGYSNISITYIKSGTITSGSINFEVSPDGMNWQAIGVAPISVDTTLVTTYPLTNGTNAWQMFVGGFNFFRVRLNPVIMGGGTASLWVQPSVWGTEFAQVVGNSIAANLQAQVQGVLAEGSSPTFPPVPVAYRDGAGNIIAPTECTLSQNFDTSSSGDTVIVAGTGGQKIRVCKLSLQDVAGGNTEHLDQGTGAGCAGSIAQVWMTYVSIAAAAEDFNSPLVLTASNSICINLANATRVTGAITYAKYP